MAASVPLTVSGGGYDFSLPSVGGIWSWTVVANNVQGAGQTYQFVNVNTPYGSLYTAAIPIPGDVVSGMADSLVQVRQQLAPLMRLVSPVPAVFDVVVAEGDPSILVGHVVVQNSGSFGSFMSATSVPDSPFLSCSPASVSAVAFGQSVQFSIQLNPASLLGGNSYQANVNLQDNRIPSTLIPVMVNVQVLPRPSISVSPGNVVFTYALLTGTPSGAVVVTVTNSGPPGSVLNFNVSKISNDSSWLTFSPASGSSIPSGGSATFVASLVPSAIPYACGTYSETLRISSPNASNPYVDVPVTLTVS